MSVNGSHEYRGLGFGRGQRSQSKIRGVRLVTIERLEELLGKGTVQDPPSPTKRKKGK